MLTGWLAKSARSFIPRIGRPLRRRSSDPAGYVAPESVASAALAAEPADPGQLTDESLVANPIARRAFAHGRKRSPRRGVASGSCISLRGYPEAPTVVEPTQLRGARRILLGGVACFLHQQIVQVERVGESLIRSIEH